MGRSADPKLTRIAASALVVRRRPALRLVSALAQGEEGEAVAAPAAKPTAKRLRVLPVVLGVIAVSIIGYLIWLGLSVVGFERQVYVPRPPTAVPAAALPDKVLTPLVQAAVPSSTRVSFADLPKGRTTILLLGTDKRENDPDHYARTDTIILVNIDAETHKVRVMSIPRDLAVPIPGYGVNKVNAAYLFGEYYKEPGGGQALIARTISDLFDVPVDYYAAINFQGFRRIVDTVGGVDIDVPYELDDYHYPTDDVGDPFGEAHVHFDAGWQHMDGLTALRYARTRHADNDFMRSKRQLQVILAARRSALSLNLIPTLPSLLDQLGGMLQTDIPFGTQVSFAHLGYNLSSSDIITSSIGSDLITPTTLKDGSEALQLNWKAARPMLAEFFGRAIAVAPGAGQATPGKATPRSATQRSAVTPAKVRTSTPTRIRRATPSATQTPPKVSPPGG